MPIKFENSSGFVSNGRPFSSPSPPVENLEEEELEVEDELPVEEEEPELPPPPPQPESEPVQTVIPDLFFDLRDYIPRTSEEAAAGDFVRLSADELTDYGIGEHESYATMYRLAPEYLKVSDKTGAKFFRSIERWYPKGYLQSGKDLDYTAEAVVALKDYANCPPNQRKAYISALRELYQRWQEWYRNRHTSLIHCPVEEGEVDDGQDDEYLASVRSQIEKSSRGLDKVLNHLKVNALKRVEQKAKQDAPEIIQHYQNTTYEELLNYVEEGTSGIERESEWISGSSSDGREYLQGQPIQRFDIHRATPEYRATDGDVEPEDIHLQRPWQEFAEDSEDSAFSDDGWGDSTGDEEWGEGVYHHPENPISFDGDA